MKDGRAKLFLLVYSPVLFILLFQAISRGEHRGICRSEPLWLDDAGFCTMFFCLPACQAGEGKLHGRTHRGNGDRGGGRNRRVEIMAGQIAHPERGEILFREVAGRNRLLSHLPVGNLADQRLHRGPDNAFRLIHHSSPQPFGGCLRPGPFIVKTDEIRVITRGVRDAVEKCPH